MLRDLHGRDGLVRERECGYEHETWWEEEEEEEVYARRRYGGWREVGDREFGRRRRRERDVGVEVRRRREGLVMVGRRG
jgi:hypothetical protein